MAARPRVGGDISLRHPLLAMLLVDKIRSLNVEYDHDVANTIGLVLYRNDRFQDAVDWFIQEIAKENDRGTATDLLVMSMAYQQLGESEQAQDCLSRADAWRPKKGLKRAQRRRIAGFDTKPLRWASHWPVDANLERAKPTRTRRPRPTRQHVSLPFAALSLK